MKVTVLVENTAAVEGLACEHGLSCHIKTAKNNILFDVGGGELFYENAKKLGVDIENVDYLIISHGHDDHGGGLETFFSLNNKAKVFIHGKAFEGHYAIKADGTKEDIGLDRKFENHPQVVKTNGNHVIGSGLTLFTNTVNIVAKPESNAGLMMENSADPKNMAGLKDDDFAHEQNLIIEEDGKTLLITGCAHNGIVNIVEQFRLLKGKMPDYCMGGFHLTSGASGSGKGPENYEVIDMVGNYLLKGETMYYTGHCTGLEPYHRLKGIMGDRVEYLSGGKIIEIK